ncbi:hypothetical protein [Nocardioides pantholopis]|uniref:hypothetical protein n=1 Tax=Nocardioides pantholopis TaxID=2483798 RepID=UPI0013DE4249|nr:hypothetical protein [Nocardioides pantholopis]
MRMDRCLRDAGQHAARALLEMDRMRNSGDPRERAAYDEVHELINDLGGALILLQVAA